MCKCVGADLYLCRCVVAWRFLVECLGFLLLGKCKVVVIQSLDNQDCHDSPSQCWQNIDFSKSNVQ